MSSLIIILKKKETFQMFLEFLKGKLWEITVHRITVQIFRFTFRASDPSSVVVGSNATQDNFL